MSSPGFALITPARFLSITDKIGETWRQIRIVLDTSSTAVPAASSSRYPLYQALGELVVDSDDYFQQSSMSEQIYQAYTNLLATVLVQSIMSGPCSAIESHMQERGGSVAGSIVGIETFLAWYNGSGGSAFSTLASPDFAELYFYARGAVLAPAGVMSPAIHPHLDSAATNGMGVRAVGGSATVGAAVDTTKHSAVVPILEVTANFSGGSAAPTVTVGGVDDQADSGTQWTATLDSNNPASAVSTTLSATTTAMSRQTVAVASASGIMVGSVLKVDSGLVGEEVVVVEGVSGSDVTAVFRKAHGAGATVTGFRSYTLTPSVAGRRLVSLTSITIGTTGHAAGTVRVVGRRDRDNNPD